jgi:predicted nuclease of predicted toxin-antitoxin system
MLPPAIAEQLRLRGHEVESVKEHGELRGMPDERLFWTAQSEGRAIVTKNLDDFRLLSARELRAGRSHCGVIFLDNRSFSRSGSAFVGQVVTALEALLISGMDLTNREHWLKPRGL